MAVTTANTLGALLAQRVGQPAAAPLLRWDGGGTAWSSLDAKTFAQRVASLKAALPVARGERVAWLGFNHPAKLALLFALAQRGAILVPLNHRLTPADWAYVLTDSSPSLLLHDAAFAEPARALAGVKGLRALGIDEVPLHVQATTPDVGEADDSVLLVYSAGHTDAPRAAVHSQRGLLSQIETAVEVFGLTPGDTVLSALPLFSAGGACPLSLGAFAVGAPIVLHSRFDPQAVLDAIGRDRPSLVRLLPAGLQALTQLPRWSAADLGSLRAVWTGWAPLAVGTAQAFLERGVPVGLAYGTAETGPLALAVPPSTGGALGDKTCGLPVPGVDVMMVNGEDAPVQPGRVGELCLRGPGMAKSLWPDEDLPDADGFFHSGDLAFSDAEGRVTLVGRARETITSSGGHIPANEVEDLLTEHPWVAECAVLGQTEHRDGEERPREVCVAVVVLREGAPTHWAQDLASSLEGRLPRTQWPERWQQAPALPRSALGQVQKPALRAWLASLPPA